MQDSSQQKTSGWAPGDTVGPFRLLSVAAQSSGMIDARASQDDGALRLLRRLPDAEPDEQSVRRFRHGFDVSRLFDHVHILSPETLAIEQGVIYQSLPWTDTVTLSDCLQHGPLDVGAVLCVGIALCEALEVVHARHVIHCAVSPDHVLVSEDCAGPDGPARVLLTGFDDAVDAEAPADQSLLAPSRAPSSDMAYFAPEQTGRMARRVDYRADFYGLGATLYAALSGRPPFPFNDAAELAHAHLAAPVPELTQLVPGVNPALAAVIHRLLGKDPEARYQTHAVLLRDLRDIERAARRGELPAAFSPGYSDFPEHLQIPAGLYGRDRERGIIDAAIRAVAQGSRRMLVLQGLPGSGKTALVNELRGKLISGRGNFVSGKFGQFGQSTPYAAFTSALAQRARQILGLEVATQLAWKARLTEALGANVGVLSEAVPEFRLLLGQTPAAIPLPPGQAEHRFLRCMRLTVGALLSSRDPLVLFIDDLQWADAASLRLLKELACDELLQHLLIILAYRENEVTSGHPFGEVLDELTSWPTTVDRMTVGGLTHSDISALLSDGLRRPAAEVDELAGLCLRKTAGNPFFLRRFLEELYRRDLLRVGQNAAGELRWDWSLADIEAAPVSDNVIGLMLGQLRELPDITRHVLTRAAFLGPIFDADSLAAISGLPLEALLESLRPAILAQLVVSAGPHSQFAFTHDRIQEAALELVPERDRPQLHLSIGRQLLQAQSSIDFTVVNHLNQGRALITDSGELAQLCRANRTVAQRALDAAAFELAANYADAAVRDLAQSAWRDSVDETVDLYVLAARAAALAGHSQRMLELIEEGLSRLPDSARLERARLLEVQVESCYASGELLQTLELGQQALALLGAERAAPASSLREELARVRDHIAAMGLDAIAALPAMNAQADLLQISIVSKMTAAAYISRPEILPLLTLQQVEVMLKNGHAPAAMSAWSVLGLMIAEFLGDYRFGYNLGALSMQLLERHGWRQVLAHTGFSFNAFLRHWVEPLEATLPGLLEVLRNGQEFGNLRHAGLGLYVHDYHAFLASPDLRLLSRQLSEHATLLSRIRQPVAADYQTVLRALVAALRGETPRDAAFETSAWSATQLEDAYRQRNDQTGTMFLHTWRGLWLFLCRRYADCLADVSAAEPLFPAARGMHAVPMVVFMRAVCALRVADTSGVQGAMQCAEKALERFQAWAQVNPGAFAFQASLLRAELARARGDDAESDFLEAIQQAEAGGRLLHQIMAYTLQAEWLQSRQLPGATASFSQARLLALQWGAEGIFDAPRRPTAGPATGNPIDLSSLTKAVQLITGEISLPRLLEQLTSVLAENAGADHAAILLRHTSAENEPADWQVVADTAVDGTLCQLPLTEAGERLPVALLHTVVATGQPLLIAHVLDDPEWSADPWLQRHDVRSVLCIPLLRQQQLMGVIYLGNSRVAEAFSGDGVRFLELLSGNIVNALDNARLYQELSELAQSLELRVEERTRQLQASEGRLRLLLEHSPVPTTVVTRAEGILLYANPAAAELAGVPIDELIGQPAVNFYRDPGRRGELMSIYRKTGRLRDEEVCLILSDHREHWVMTSMVPIDFDGEEVDLATLVDITERKEMEKKLQSLATTDALTGLANRRQLFSGLQLEIARARRHGTSLVLAMFDLDHFKRINDTWGHSAGDDMLREVADVCRRTTRGEDLVARFGGEEYAVVMPMTEIVESRSLVERLRQRIASLLLLSADGEKIQCTASFGVARLRADDSADSLLARADAALYQAKSAGRNCVQIADDAPAAG